jgi:hypothetical protein
MQRNFILTLAGLWCFSLTSCSAPNETTWSAQSLSPDHAWLALAHSEHTNHGFGGESVWTIVEMKQNISNGAPVQVLEFDEGPDSVHDLKMNWPSPNHLDITYRGDPPITFQAIKAFGKDVTVERLQQN